MAAAQKFAGDLGNGKIYKCIVGDVGLRTKTFQIRSRSQKASLSDTHDFGPEQI